MTFRKATESDIPRIAALVARGTNGTLSNPPAAIATQIKRDVEGGAGPFEWLLTDTSAGIAVARIAVIPPPPIYDLKGGLAGVAMDTWQLPSIEPLERHLRDRGAAMLVMDCRADDAAKRSQLEALGYVATTHYMLKPALAPSALSSTVRAATESDIPALVAFNREARERLHEANPAFWTSHPDAETRFAFWMKMSLTMRDRTIFVSEHGRPTGFVIAQPASPIQVPIALDETKIGVIDDFHASSFGTSLVEGREPTPARELLAIAEADFTKRGRTAAMAICPAAWPAKRSRLEAAGYETHHTWFTHPA
jgi:hypothetical protein